MLFTTLNRIRAKQPCLEGWATLLTYLGKTKADDEPLALGEILASNGLIDALWCLGAVEEPAFCRRLAVAFAREVQHLMRDPRSIAALDVAERFADGLVSGEELEEARRGAYAAADHAAAAEAASYYAAGCAAAKATSYYAAAHYAAEAAEAEAASSDAYTKAKAKQSEIFQRLLKEHQS